MTGHPGGAYFVFGSADPRGVGLYAQGPAQIWHVWLVDVAGTTIAIVIDEYAGTPPADKAAALGIVETMTISR